MSLGQHELFIQIMKIDFSNFFRWFTLNSRQLFSAESSSHITFPCKLYSNNGFNDPCPCESELRAPVASAIFQKQHDKVCHWFALLFRSGQILLFASSSRNSQREGQRAHFIWINMQGCQLWRSASVNQHYSSVGHVALTRGSWARRPLITSAHVE